MEKNILNKILTESKKTKAIISAWRYDEDDSFYVGYIVDFNDSLFIMQQVSTNGVPDGLLIESFNNIEKFEIGDYEKSYQYLFLNTDKIAKQSVNTLRLPKGENWKYELIKELSTKGKVITIQVKSDNTILTGFIVDFDESYLRFKSITQIGQDDDESIYKLSDLSTFTIDEVESRRRQAFNDWRKGAGDR